MKFLSARWALSAGIIAAASVAAFVAPSAANAALPGHCAGASEIIGQGSTFAEVAHHIWGPDFASPSFSGKKGGCENVTVKYNPEKPEGSGAGYARWATKEEYGTTSFVGTDNTVNNAEKIAVENEVNTGLEKPTVNGKGEPEGGASNLLTVPILSGAVAIVVHLPEHCQSTSSPASNRLAMNQGMVEKIYKEPTTWKEVAEQPSTGNKIESDGSGTCELAADVTPVVRLDGSGTTHIFKEALAKNDTSLLKDETGEEHTWLQLAEGTASIKCGGAKDAHLNECWPTAAGVVRGDGSGNPGVLKRVGETPGTIGYADLAQARTEGGITEGKRSEFWAAVESSAKMKGAEVKSRKYAEPSTNGYSSTPAESNCKKTEFVNGTSTFPPPSVLKNWNEVGAKRESKTYPFCGLTYMLVNTNYAAYSEHGGNTPEAQSVKDYLAFITGKKGGAVAIAGKDYFPEPKSLLAKVQEALSLMEG